MVLKKETWITAWNCIPARKLYMTHESHPYIIYLHFMVAYYYPRTAIRMQHDAPVHHPWPPSFSTSGLYLVLMGLSLRAFFKPRPCFSFLEMPLTSKHHETSVHWDRWDPAAGGQGLTACILIPSKIDGTECNSKVLAQSVNPLITGLSKNRADRKLQHCYHIQYNMENTLKPSSLSFYQKYQTTPYHPIS